MRIKSILVPTDFSKNAQLAFEHAFELAQQTAAKLVLLHVQENAPASPTRAESRRKRVGEPESAQELERIVKSRFAEMLTGHDVTTVNLRSEPLRGAPDIVICNYAQNTSADIVFMGARGTSAKGRGKKVVIGSVTESVLRKCKIPVVVVTENVRRKAESKGVGRF